MADIQQYDELNVMADESSLERVLSCMETIDAELKHLDYQHPVFESLRKNLNARGKHPIAGWYQMIEEVKSRLPKI